jgi:hypothetical protein
MQEAEIETRWRWWFERHHPESSREVLAAEVILTKLFVGERRDNIARRAKDVDVWSIWSYRAVRS